MTREDKLYSMTGATLIKVADNLGVKVACNKVRTQLKESKSAVIARILAAEQVIESTNSEIKPEEEKEELISAAEITSDINDETEIIDDVNDEWEDNSYEEKKKKAAESDSEAESSINKKSRPGKGAQLEYKGKSQNICAWAKELGISPNTLYGRIYKMGWTIEKAFETKPKRK